MQAKTEKAETQVGQEHAEQQPYRGLATTAVLLLTAIVLKYFSNTRTEEHSPQLYYCWDCSPYEKQMATQTIGEVGRWDCSPYEKQRTKQTLGEWQKKGGGRTQIEHSMLVNASVQKNPDDSGFSELVHLRALKTGVVPGAQGPDYVQKKIIGKREGEKRKQRGRKELGLRTQGLKARSPLYLAEESGVRTLLETPPVGIGICSECPVSLPRVSARFCVLSLSLRSICIGCYCRG